MSSDYTCPQNHAPLSRDDAELVDVLEAQLTKLQTGQATDPSWLVVAEHPAIAGRLRSCLFTIRLVENAVKTLSHL